MFLNKLSIFLVLALAFSILSVTPFVTVEQAFAIQVSSDQDSSSVLNQLTVDAPFISDTEPAFVPLDQIVLPYYTNNPVIMLIFLPLFGFLFIRVSNEDFDSSSFRRIASFTLIFIMLSTAVSGPAITGAYYWNTAFAQEPPPEESATEPPATDPPADTSSTDTSADPPANSSTVILRHEDIEINHSVRWFETVNFVNPPQTVAVQVPNDATIIQVVSSDGENLANSLVSDPASLDSSIPVVPIADPQILEEGAQTKLVLIDNPSQFFTIEFETAAPYTEENEQVTEDSYQNTVTVSNDSELHYTDVKSSAALPEELVEQGAEFKLYWMIDDVKTDVTSDPRFEVEFVDTDGNGIVGQMQ